MGWRTVVITQPARLTVKARQLCVTQEDTVTVPIEDISVIMIENSQVELTAVLLSELAEAHIILFSCDSRHVPNGCFIPYASHSRHTLVAKAQLDLSVPFKKRLWQQLVQQKIFNQARCLELQGSSAARLVQAISKEVASGDVTNHEAYAAKVYFSALFGDGFIPCLGLHHDSELNNFNLADDLIEPFRPIVDLWAANVVLGDEKQALTKEDRISLIDLLHHDIMINNGKHSVLNAIDKLTGTLSTAMQNQDLNALHLPELVPLSKHSYE